MGYSRKVVHPPLEEWKIASKFFSGIPKTNKEIGYRGTIFKEENNLEFQGKIRKQGIDEHHSKRNWLEFQE